MVVRTTDAWLLTEVGCKGNASSYRASGMQFGEEKNEALIKIL